MRSNILLFSYVSWLCLQGAAPAMGQNDPREQATPRPAAGPSSSPSFAHDRTEVWDGSQRRWVKAVKLENGSTIPVGEYNTLWDPNDEASKEEIGRGYNRYDGEGTESSRGGRTVIRPPRRGGGGGSGSARVTHQSCSTMRVRRG